MRTMLLVVAAISIFSYSSYAKVWRVNNNTGANANFISLQAAHDSVPSGDTLHLEASATSYGGLSCSKKLTIIGTGYFLNENANSQAITQSSKVGQIYLYDGSAGTVIMGLDFQGSGINVYAHDIVIKRNKFSSPNGSTPDYNVGTISINYAQNNGNIAANNVIITQNYGVRIDVNYPSTGILITNNFLSYPSYTGETTTGQVLVQHANAISLVQNNIFRRGRVTANNSSFTNNIMYTGFFEGTGNLVSNNLANASQFGTANNNKENVDMAAVFVGAGTDVSSDGQWKLKSGSPAIGAGYGSTTANPIDAGIFGGQTPYMLAGLPPVPAIYFFENQPIGSNSDPIDVTIKVKSVSN